MTRTFKTSRKKREQYIYHFDNGEKEVLEVGKNGVTEVDIQSLHAFDDIEVDARRREDYHFKPVLMSELSEQVALDKSATFAETTTPFDVLLEKEESEIQENLLLELHQALKTLTPAQFATYQKSYIEKLSNVAIAKEEGVSEAAIRDRLKAMEKKIKKYFSKVPSNSPLFSLIHEGGKSCS